MLLPTLLSTAALLVSASSFLLPPGAGQAANGLWADLAQPVIEVDCPGCGFAVGEGNGPYAWVDGVESSLLLNFSLSLDDKTILLNDKVFHPLHFPHLESFYAPLVRKSKSDSLPDLTPPIRLGYALETAPVAKDEEHEILNLQFTVFDLAGRQVHIDTVRVKVSKDKDGKILLMVIDTIPVDVPGSPSAIGMECKNSLCRMRAMIMAKIREALEKAKNAANAVKDSKPVAWAKGCHNKFRGGRPHHQGANKDGHGKRPHHHHPHGHHHDGHRLRAFFRRFVHQFVVPIMFGIVAGMTAGALGMLIGHAIGYLWIKYVRGGQRGPYAQVSQQEEAVESDEKDGLMAECPPQYEELEGDTVKVDEKN